MGYEVVILEVWYCARMKTPKIPALYPQAAVVNAFKNWLSLTKSPLPMALGGARFLNNPQHWAMVQDYEALWSPMKPNGSNMEGWWLAMGLLWFVDTLPRSAKPNWEA